MRGDPPPSPKRREMPFQAGLLLGVLPRRLKSIGGNDRYFPLKPLNWLGESRHLECNCGLYESSNSGSVCVRSSPRKANSPVSDVRPSNCGEAPKLKDLVGSDG